MKRLGSWVLIGAVVIGGCSAIPQWVKSGRSSSHPDDEYLVAIREGDTPASSKQNCRQALKAFLAKETERPESPVGRYRSDISRGPKAIESSLLRDLPGTLDRATGEILDGMKLVETWRDPVSAKVSGLAVIERKPEAERIKAKLDSLAQEVKTAQSGSESTQDITAKKKALMDTLAVLLSYQVWNTLLAAVDPSGQGLPAPVVAGDVLRKMGEAGPPVKISLQVTGDRSAAVKDALEGHLQSMGYDVVSDDPDVILSAYVEGTVQKMETLQETVTVYKKTEETTAGGVEARHQETLEVPASKGGPPSGGYVTFVSWMATVSVQNAKNKKTLSRFVERGRDGQPGETEAWHEAIAHIGESVSKKVGSALIHFVPPAP